MNFVFFGYDFSLPVLKRLLDDGHTCLGIFTFPCDNFFNFNRDLLRLASDLDVPATDGRVTSGDIRHFIGDGCACFLAAGYLYKIPVISEGAYGINIHPSLLPKGRGLMPTPYILTDYPEAAGLSVHKLTSEFDAGDILYQESFVLDAQETVETYSERIARRMPDIISTIFSDLPGYWSKAVPQNEEEALYFPLPTDAMRTLDYSLPVSRLDKIRRAFGHFGTLCKIEGGLYVVFDSETWSEPHNQSPGTVLRPEGGDCIVVAVRDGFIRFKRFERLK